MKGIYKITNPNGKVYIGQCKDFNKRMALYKGGHCKKQIALYASIIKYGWDNHTAEFIEACDNLDEREIYYIQLYDTYNTPNGLNLRSGGSTSKWSNESKAKLSKSLMGIKRPYLSERNSLKKGMPVVSPPPSWAGKKHSDETRSKMSESARLRVRTDEMKANMSASAKLKVFTPEHRAKLLASRLNSDKTGKRVIDTSNNEVFKNLTYMCKLKGLSYGAIKAKLNGNNKNNTTYQYL